MSTANEDAKRSKAIDDLIENDAKKTRRECKILLLGEDMTQTKFSIA